MATVRFIQHLFGSGPHSLFLGITYLGASVVLWTLLVLYHWLVDPHFGRRLAVAFAASILANRILKELFGTSRPFEMDAILSDEGSRRTAGGHGFPSGHSQNAATFWLAFAFRYQRPWLWAAAILVVLCVGLSRLYLGVHMPEDVGGGFVIGAVFAWLAAWMGKRWFATAPSRRRIWDPAVGAGTLVLALAVGADPGACGLLAGCFLARADFEPPRTAGGRIGIVIGGGLLLGLFWLLLSWVPARIQPGLEASPGAAYLRYLVLALVGLDLWPRIWQGLTGSPAAASVRS